MIMEFKYALLVFAFFFAKKIYIFIICEFRKTIYKIALLKPQKPYFTVSLKKLNFNIKG
jgi:hypothetical protein